MRPGALVIVGMLLGGGIATAQFPPVPPGGAAGFAPGGGFPPMPGPGFSGVPGAGVSGFPRPGFPGGGVSGIPGGGVTGFPGGGVTGFPGGGATGFSGGGATGFSGGGFTGIPRWETKKQCLSCFRDVPDSSGVGQQCPHCGVTWNREIGAGASRSDSRNAFGPVPPSGSGTPFMPMPPTGGGNPFAGAPPSFTPNPGDPGLPPSTPLNPFIPSPNNNLNPPLLNPDAGNFFNFGTGKKTEVKDDDDDEGWSAGEIGTIVGGVSLLGIALGVVLKVLGNNAR